MTAPQDFYALLGLRRTASSEEIRQAYFSAARRLHPDKNLAPGDTELFLDIQEAYEVLTNPRRKAKYDASLPPEKPASSFLDTRFVFSRQNLMLIDEPQIVYVIAEFSTPKDQEKIPSPPLNLCLVLDRSTSMQGGNMDMVKSTAIQIMRKLKEEDIFSVVTFSDRAETIIPASRGTELSRQEARIQMLQPSGGTEVYSGLELAYNEVMRNANRSHVNHIILLTDGRTYGDEARCIELAQRASGNGIGISGLGIGSEWNDNFLDQLASTTGGTSMYLPHAQDIQKALLDKFNQLGKAYAEETRLEFETQPHVELRYAFRLQPDAGLLSFESPLVMGPIARDYSLRVLFEFIVQPESTQTSKATLFKGDLYATLGDQTFQEKSMPVTFERPVLEETDATPPPTEIVEALSRLKLYRLQEQARLEVTAGNFDQAAEHLTRLATHLLAQGERGLAKTALMEADNIQRKKSFSQQGGKEIKYGTRALLLSGRKEGQP